MENEPTATPEPQDAAPASESPTEERRPRTNGEPRRFDRRPREAAREPRTNGDQVEAAPAPDAPQRKWYSITELNEMAGKELLVLAKDLNVPDLAEIKKKDDLVLRILHQPHQLPLQVTGKPP